MPVNSLGTNGGAAQATAELGVEHGDRIGLFPPPDDGGHALENLLTFPVVDDPRGGGEPAQRPLRFTFGQLFYEVTDVTHAGWMTKSHATRKPSGNRRDHVRRGWSPYGQPEAPMRRLTARARRPQECHSLAPWVAGVHHRGPHGPHARDWRRHGGFLGGGRGGAARPPVRRTRSARGRSRGRNQARDDVRAWQQHAADLPRLARAAADVSAHHRDWRHAVPAED